MSVGEATKIEDGKNEATKPKAIFVEPFPISFSMMRRNVDLSRDF
jgi:hypothetical protein